MDTKDILNREFFAQDFAEEQPYAEMLNRYKDIACNYARNLIHPDDLAGKHLQELCYFHFVKRQPKKKRAHYYLTSKEIAETLSISINTVSRHRQEILGKLQVKNSIEACRIAKDLKLI